VFPAPSETFVVDHAAGLLELGHEVSVVAERRPEPPQPAEAKVRDHALLEHVEYMTLPAEVEAELSVWPPWEHTWPPGASRPVRNARRVARAVPVALRTAASAPATTRRTLDSRSFGFQAASLSALHRLDRLLRVRRPVDVCHAHFGPVAQNIRFVRRLWRAPLVATFHGYDFSRWPLEHGPDVYAPLFAEVDVVTVNSEHARSRLVELGCPDHVLRRVNVGIDVSSFTERTPPRREGPLRLLTVGRLTEKKGHDTAIRAVARAIAQAGAEVVYDIVGDGDERAAVEAAVEEAGLRGVVRLHGAQPRPYVRRLLEEADVFVLASRTAANGDQEGTPVVLMEAQASCVPVVSTRHSGIPEIVADGVTGLLADEDDDAGIAAQLIRLFTDAAERERLGRNGREHIRACHDLSAINAHLCDIYRELQERGAPWAGA